MTQTAAAGNATRNLWPGRARVGAVLGGALGLLGLVFGIWAGLLRLGWRIPAPQPDLPLVHGPLMVCGFLGTLISLERAVAVRRDWAYAAPLLLGSGGLLLALNLPRPAAALLLAGGLGLIAIYAVVLRRAGSDFTLVMLLGAVCLFLGNLFWAYGVMIPLMVYWWEGFLLLTIFGERMELSRVRPRRRWKCVLGYTALGLYGFALALATQHPVTGMRVAGVAMLAMATWLLGCDTARSLLRRSGLPRYIGATLLAGYAWLAAAGVLWIICSGSLFFGYDALLHSFFLGFVMAMVFAHAPIILPAISGRALIWRKSFYAPVGLLQFSLMIRIAVDLSRHTNLTVWRWAGMINATALLWFVALAALALLRGRRAGKTRSSAAVH